MPHVVTQSCCSDGSCVFACPVNCIHPTPDEPDFLTAEMLHIDPKACVDCGACVSACPVDAIAPQSRLRPDQQIFIPINAAYYADDDASTRPWLAPVTPAPEVRDRGLRVAIVGSGPAAMYAADELLTQPGVRVNVFDRLPVPYGLVRSGVAPDHPKTKRVTDLFDTIAGQDGLEFYLNVEVGRDITPAELLEHHHAVIYAHGAATDRPLDVPGADLPGSASATEFIAWVNGHPDYRDWSVDLSHRRAVIIGNGNVALDVARMLTADPDHLATTDISDVALAALRRSRIEEVVIVGRRGPAQSAFTLPELIGLSNYADATVTLAGDDRELVAKAAVDAEGEVAAKLEVLSGAAEAAEPGRRAINLRYLLSPAEVLGSVGADGVGPTDGSTTGVRGVRFVVNAIDHAGAVTATDRTVDLDAGLVLRSIGYRGRPLAGVPFDPDRGVIPTIGGRVLDGVAGAPVAGLYAVGWIKRGPSGFIGTNKSCSQETVGALVDDFNSGRLAAPRHDDAQLSAVIAGRGADRIDRRGWQRIDRRERESGHGVRDRVKYLTTDELIAAAAADRRRTRRGPIRIIRSEHR